MSSFQQEVGKTREMLEGTNRTLTGTDDVIYFRPPIKIRLKSLYKMNNSTKLQI